MTETTKKEPTKKKSKAVTSALGEPLMAELEAAAKLTGESQAELVRSVFERWTPTAAEIASAHMDLRISKDKAAIEKLIQEHQRLLDLVAETRAKAAGGSAA